jgi:hypothetical protein
MCVCVCEREREREGEGGRGARVHRDPSAEGTRSDTSFAIHFDLLRHVAVSILGFEHAKLWHEHVSYKELLTRKEPPCIPTKDTKKQKEKRLII